MTPHGRFIAFYSHKGGVGRSLVLANVAYELARLGRKILVLDLDLEAPGQHMTDLFRPRIAHARDLMGWPGKGLLELFETWMSEHDRQAFDFDLTDFLRPPRQEVADKLAEQSGALWLLPAGDDSDVGYAQRISGFSWKDFYQADGQALLRNLKHRFLAEGFDHVLIDARTGISDELYVSALELADTVVVVSGFNWQNVDGTRKVVDALRSAEVEREFEKKRLLLVGSPVPTMIGGELLARRRADIRMQWPRFQGFHAELPYDADLALEERVFAWERDIGLESKPYVLAIDKLLSGIQAVEDPPVLVEKQIKQTNPFALIRRDYIKDEDVARFFVDPGGNIVEDMGRFTPIIVTGARGSGKTMLASKFALDVRLAEQRRLFGKERIEAIDQLGLYFRIDADFLDSFNQSDAALRDTFDRLFSQFFDIVVIRKALLALESLGGIVAWCDEERLFRGLFAEFAEKPVVLTQAAFADFLELQLVEIRLYLNNPGRRECPILISANSLMKRLMEELRRDGRFGDRYFVILIDEYENYAEYQQCIINTRLKQSRREDGVTYRLFMRNGGLVTRETLAPGQTIEETHDYRRHSLDEDLDFKDFSRHALKVANRHLEEDDWFRNNGYVNVEALFEELPAEDEARLLVDGGGRKDELIAWVRSKFSDDAPVLLEWMRGEANPLRRAVAVVMLNQGKSAAAIVAGFRANSSEARNWYHNYHRGALHWLCRLYHTPKKYAGLNTVLGLAGNNIRVFLDYCHAIIAEWMADGCPPLPISWRLQNDAIHRQAVILRENLYSAARSTAEVNQFLERIGRLFEAAHKGPRQSEPEINHFALRGEVGDAASRDRLDKWLLDAWYEGILRQMRGNKQKSLHDLRQEDWQIAPWLAPLFNLSTRRKKKISLAGEEVLTLFHGSESAWKKLFRKKEVEFERIGGSEAGERNKGGFSMSRSVLDWTPDEAPAQLEAAGPWDVLIVSGRNIDEPRACWSRDSLRTLPLVHLCRAEEDIPQRFTVKNQVGNVEEVDWKSLAHWLETHLPPQARVLIDMNLLAFDTLLYLLPALLVCRLEKLACLYVAPENYTFPEQALTDQKLHPIEQPKGYVSLALDPDRQGARHLVFLGFDKARAWKFIDRYDWKEEHRYVVLGDPPFVPEGVARARSAAEPWLSEFERDFPGHVQSVSAIDPAAVAAFCLAHFRQARWLDLAPLGPKPMNLGLLWFYFGLSEAERGRVRLLYDFPVQRVPRSRGVARVHFFDCRGLLV